MRVLVTAAILLGPIAGVSASERVCYWQGQSYSEGAVAKTQAGDRLVCTCTSDGLCVLDRLPEQYHHWQHGSAPTGVRG
jgi:hypothetical protein